MTMFARDLSVAHYRSFDSYRLALDEGVTILAGPNAAGKTNLIEALQLLTSGASFRHPTAAELVHDGVGSCKVELRLEGDGRVLDMGLSVGTVSARLAATARDVLPPVCAGFCRACCFAPTIWTWLSEAPVCAAPPSMTLACN